MSQVSVFGLRRFQVSTWQWFCLHLDLELLTHRCGSAVDIWCDYPEDGGTWIECNARLRNWRLYAPPGGWTEDGLDEMCEDEAETCKEYLEAVLERFPGLVEQVCLDRRVRYRVYLDDSLRFEK